MDLSTAKEIVLKAALENFEQGKLNNSLYSILQETVSNLKEEIGLTKDQVFNSRDNMPFKMWYECLNKAVYEGYDYIEFNGMVFKTSNPVIDYDNSICLWEDLK